MSPQSLRGFALAHTRMDDAKSLCGLFSLPFKWPKHTMHVADIFDSRP